MSTPSPIREITTARHDAMSALDRTARVPHLLDVPRDVVRAMQDIDLLIVAQGSVGQNTTDVAARMGVGSLRLIDPACFKPESILTHPIAPKDLGLAKVEVAGERAKAVSPATRVFTFRGSFEDAPIAFLAGATHIMLSSDNQACEVAVTQMALHLGVPLIQSSVHGATLCAQVRSLAANTAGDTACAACIYTDREWSDLDRGTVFACDGGATSTAAEPSRVPTASFPHVCAIASHLGVMELMRRALGIGSPRESRMVEYCGYNQRTTVTSLARRAECPLDHEPVRVEAGSEDLGARTPRELVRAAGYADADPRRVTLKAEGFTFAGLLTCHCDAHSMLGRFLSRGESAGICPDCDVQRAPHPLYTTEETPVSALAGELTLAFLGARAPGSVWVRGSQGAVLFVRQFPNSPARSRSQR